MPDVLLNVQSGLSTGLQSVAVENGTFRVTTDTQKLFVDLNNVRTPLCDVILGNTEQQIKAITAANALPKVYLSSDTLSLFFFDTTTYIPDGESEAVAKGWTQIGINGAVERAVKDADGNVITSTYETITSAQNRQTTLQNNIDALAAVVGQINSFEYQIISDISQAPVPGSSNVIYFVPDNAIPSNPDYNVYKEYLWLTTTPANPEADPPVEAQGHYEIIGTTETDLSNYYTKSEADGIASDLWRALGLTTTDIADTNYVSVDDRLSAEETATARLDAELGTLDSTASGYQTVADRLTAEEAATAEFQAQIGNLDSTVTGYQTIDARISALENDSTSADGIAEINAKIGADYPNSTDTGFSSINTRLTAEETATSRLDAELGTLDSTAADYVTVADRLTAEETATARIDAELGTLDSTSTNYQTVAQRLTTSEADIDELQAQLGSDYPATTDSNFSSVSARLTALETDTTDADAVAEINAKLGNYTDSTEAGFVSVEDRFTALETEVGAATSPDAASLRGRMATAESDVDELEAQLGNLDSTSIGYVSVADRLTAEETATARLDAELGSLDSTAADYVSVADRLDAEEATSAELQAQLGSLDSTATGYVSVADRLTAEETATARLDAELGSLDSTAAGYKTVAERLTTLENDTADADAVAEINAKLGNYKDSTDNDFVSVEDRFGNNEDAIAEIQAKIGSTYPDSTATGFESIDTRLTNIMNAVGNINRFNIIVVDPAVGLPTTGESYTIYFVPVAPGADDNDGHTKYIEYMWIVDTNLAAGGYYEEIGITEADLSEYYTSAEVDSLFSVERARVSTLESAIGSVDPTATGYVTIMSRLSTAESDIDELEAKFGTYAASTAAGFTTVESRFTAIENDTAELHAQLGTLDSTATGYQTVAQRLTAEEAVSAELQAQIGNLDSTVTGYQTIDARISAIEGGSVTQSLNDDDAEKPLLVSGSNSHDTVEYVPGVTVNADDNSLSATALNATDVNTTNVTATTATATEVVLGDATLTFDSTTGALVINF